MSWKNVRPGCYPCSIYDDLLELQDRMHRVLPQPPHTYDPPQNFCPARDILIEANALEIRELALDPARYRLASDKIRSVPHGNRRQLAQKATQHSSVWEDQLETDAAMPHGVRLWHSNERVRGILVHVKHDLRELFDSHDAAPGLQPYSEQDQAKTLFTVPTGDLGFSDVLKLLAQHSPYLSRACREYAQMACWMYGLSMEEFAMLTRVSFTRHTLDGGKTTIKLLQGGGGFHDSGPLMKVHIGVPCIAHNMSPSLTTPDCAPPPVRITVGEGMLMTLDGYARACYAHGYAHHGPVRFYTLDFSMDCMRCTRLLTRNQETQGLVMYTPVLTKHVVQSRHSMVQNDTLEKSPAVETCSVVWRLINTMRGRLQDAESSLMASKYTSK
jgi:hypothetical protein